jgi:hypothetical protein
LGVVHACGEIKADTTKMMKKSKYRDRIGSPVDSKPTPK